MEKVTYFAIVTGDDGHYSSRILPVKNGSNLLLALKNVEDLVFITPCDNKLCAESLVRYWQECQKKNEATMKQIEQEQLEREK